jgi:hypothetical protein
MNPNSNNPSPATVPVAYAVVAGKDIIHDDDESYNYHPAAAADVRFDIPHQHHDGTGRVAEHYRRVLPETRNLTWDDDYFDNNNNNSSSAGDSNNNNNGEVIAVFDLDYDSMEEYYSQLGWCWYGASCLIPNCFWTATLLGAPCFLRQNVQWSVRAQHVAVTRDGVLIVREHRPTCWGSSCTDAGRSSKLVRGIGRKEWEVMNRFPPFFALFLCKHDTYSIRLKHTSRHKRLLL